MKVSNNTLIVLNLFISGCDENHDKILNLLKVQGALTAKSLADELGLTTMGIRQHVLALEESGDVTYKDEKAARGRPTRFWSLTEKKVMNILLTDMMN